VLILTPGNTADCVMAQECVSLIPASRNSWPGYDTDAFRAFLKDQKIKPVIPGKSNREKRIRHDKSAGKNRNVIARCLGRLKDFRRIATRYDKLAGIFFSALCLVAIVAHWL
jgi:transposase